VQDAANKVDDSFGEIVSDLVALVEHLQGSIALIDRAISREVSLGEPVTGNVIVLDDVTPQYLKARYALNTCSASLDAVLKSLPGASESARRATRG
jgi:hypothetical protein